jgi:hypothetical protein
MRAWREGAARPAGRRGAAPGERGEVPTSEPPYGMILLALSSLVEPAPGSLLDPADVDVAADRVAELPEDERLLLALAFHTWKLDRDLVRRTLEATLARAHTAGGATTIPAFEAPGRPAPFRTASRLTSLALYLASLVEPRDPTTTRLASGLLGMRAGGHWGHTQDDAWALLALAAYHDRVERRAGPVAGEVRWTGEAEPLLALAAPGGALVRRTRTVLLPAAVGGASLGLDFEPDGLLHYVATLRWDEEAGRRGAEDAGFSITRRVERYEGTGPVRLGDLVVLTLEVVVPRDAWYLAVVEPLPAGLEIVQGEFATESRRVAETLARWSSPHPRLPATHVERGDRELRVFADRVAPGVYAHHAVARVRATGSFVHLPARVEAMYSPGLRGTTPVERFRASGEEKPR